MTNVLLVDDDANLRFLTARILNQLGCKVHAFSNPIEALEVLKELNFFDVVFTDFSMPLMNGLEFAEKVKALYPDLPVVLASITNFADLEQDALSKGIEFLFLEKHDKETIKTALDKVLS
jgi:CheY-like chemotaxis protein